MDLYTTSFSYPRSTPLNLRSTASPHPTNLNLPGSGGMQTLPLPNVTSATTPPKKPSSSVPLTTAAQVEKDWQAVEKLVLDITSREGCLVTVTKEQIGSEQSSPIYPAVSNFDSTSAVEDVTRSKSDSGNGNGVKATNGTVWNFHLSGNYQAVMAAKGGILREIPRDNRTLIRVPRTDVLESPLATTSVLKADIKRRLDDIAAESRAHIAVINLNVPGKASSGALLAETGKEEGENGHHDVNPDGRSGSAPTSGPDRVTQVEQAGASGDSSATGVSRGEGREADEAVNATTGVKDGANVPAASSDQKPGPAPMTGFSVSYGLETERMCELVITGNVESVEIAKVRLLVMLDELSGLHAEVCDIDYKLHGIIASRKRCVIQSIQEETATNIYFPTQLVGVLNRSQQTSAPGPGYRNINMPNSPLSPTMPAHLHDHMNSYMGQGAPGPGVAPGQGLNGMPIGMPNHPMSNMSSPAFPNGGFASPTPSNLSHPHHQPQHHHHQQHPPHHHHLRHNNPPTYNPHQHVHYPYQPQPLDINPQASRGLPYTGPGMHHFNSGPAPMNGMPGPNVHPHSHLHGPPHGPPLPPLSVNHTGMSGISGMSNMSAMSPMSQIPNPFHSHRGMTSPMPMSMSPGPGMHTGHLTPGSGHPHQMTGGPMLGPGGPAGPNMTGPGGLGMGMNMPAYSPGGESNGHGQMHPGGFGTGPMSMSGSMSNLSSPGGLGMNMPMSGGGMGGFPQAPSHPGLQVNGGERGVLGKSNHIWITGEFFSVQRARDMLLNVAVQKSKLVISRDTAVLPRKLDWLLTGRIEEVRNIMNDNGTYIQVPSVGSHASLLTVFGDHRVNIERTIRSLMALTCQFYIASFWLLPISFDVLMPQATLNPAQMQPILKRISHSTGCEVVFKSNCFEFHGLEQEVRAAVMMALELDIIKGFHHEIRFQIELANEHRDFIAGKKNGKINKIMKMAGVKIKFETFNDYNFLMDISGSDIGALQGLSLLQEELPAEVSFHVPESYHKRIIGVGGKNIQRIMKTYGVYVKFSNAEEFAALGGYIDNEDNVVARTPAKNAINLESLKQAVMDLVNPNDKDYTVECISIPRRYHRTLLGEKSIFIHDIEHKTNSLVRFPYKETASDIVTIFGPELQVHIAAAMLLDHVPFEADLHVPPNAELPRLITSPEFIMFAEKIKRDHQIAIVPSVTPGSSDEAIFKFRCQRSNIDFLGTARDSLEEFLGQHNIQVYPSNAYKKEDSFADAFSHFNSKLLSTRNKAVEEEADQAHAEHRPRPVSATGELKALFDWNTSHHGAARSIDDATLPRFMNSIDTNTLSSGPWKNNHPGPYNRSHNPAAASTSNLAAASGIKPSGADRADSDPSKGDSGPVLRQPVSSHHPPSHAPRSAGGARTQSLDIKLLDFSRALTGSGSPNATFGPIPSSPPTGGPTASNPNTATGPYFPRPNMGRNPASSVENLTQGINNVQISHQS